MTLIPALRQRQVDLSEFKASLVYRASFRAGSKATEKPYLDKQNKKEKKEFHSIWEVVVNPLNSSTWDAEADVFV